MVTGPLQFDRYRPRTTDSRIAQSDKAKNAARTAEGRVALALRIPRAKAAKALAKLTA